MFFNKKVIIINLEGGLGNQMFQFAFANLLAQKNNASVRIDCSFFNLKEKKLGFTPRNFELNVFGNSYDEITPTELSSFFKLSFVNKVKKKLGLNYPKIYHEKSFEFNQEVLNIKLPVYLNGYFQSYKYFEGYEEFIKELFSFPKTKIDFGTQTLFNDLKSKKTISVHIRRGDYVNDKQTQQSHGNCSIQYYLDAFSYFEKIMDDFTLVFFSDDTDWVKTNFENLPYPKLFINDNQNNDSWKDMYLMTACSHHIIANSSFSWWGAWLNSNPDKIVIAPKKWFGTKNWNTSTLLPEEWIKM